MSAGSEMRRDLCGRQRGPVDRNLVEPSVRGRSPVVAGTDMQRRAKRVQRTAERLRPQRHAVEVHGYARTAVDRHDVMPRAVVQAGGQVKGAIVAVRGDSDRPPVHPDGERAIEAGGAPSGYVTQACVRRLDPRLDRTRGIGDRQSADGCTGDAAVSVRGHRLVCVADKRARGRKPRLVEFRGAGVAGRIRSCCARGLAEAVVGDGRLREDGRRVGDRRARRCHSCGRRGRATAVRIRCDDLECVRSRPGQPGQRHACCRRGCPLRDLRDRPRVRRHDVARHSVAAGWRRPRDRGLVAARSRADARDGRRASVAARGEVRGNPRRGERGAVDGDLVDTAGERRSVVWDPPADLQARSHRRCPAC